MMVMPGVHESLNKDTLTSHIIKDEAMQEAEMPTVVLPQENYVAPTKGKLAQHTFPDKGSDTEEALVVVHNNLCGPFRAKDGSLYFLLLKDQKTRYVWVRPIAKESDVLRVFDKWPTVVERQTKKSMLMLRSDRGGEFLGKAFTDFVDDKGIVHDMTCPYTPQENGMAEREMCTVVESVRTMLLHIGVHHHWWHLAQRHAVLVRNCLERSTLPPGTTPHQQLTSKKPDLTLACVARVRNRVGMTIEAIFYKIMSLEVWKVEHEPVSTLTPAVAPTDPSSTTTPLLSVEDENVKDVPPPSTPLVPSPTVASPLPLVADVPKSTSPSTPCIKGRIVASPSVPASGIAGGRRDEVHLGGQVHKPPTTGGAGDRGVPGNGDAADRGAVGKRAVGRGADFVKGKAVKAAMDEEIRSLITNGTWELVKRPRGVNVMKNRWVLMPNHVDDTVAREKARLVMKVFTQVYGADHDETYAPVKSSPRIFINIVAILDLHLMQLDMKNAFLQSKLDRVLDMYQPNYYNDRTGRVCKLLKSLYGLK
ncbi:unnamed protein product [Closterium sp. NIES-54]